MHNHICESGLWNHIRQLDENIKAKNALRNKNRNYKLQQLGFEELRDFNLKPLVEQQEKTNLELVELNKKESSSTIENIIVTYKGTDFNIPRPKVIESLSNDQKEIFDMIPTGSIVQLKENGTLKFMDVTGSNLVFSSSNKLFMINSNLVMVSGTGKVLKLNKALAQLLFYQYPDIALINKDDYKQYIDYFQSNGIDITSRPTQKQKYVKTELNKRVGSGLNDSVIA